MFQKHQIHLKGIAHKRFLLNLNESLGNYVSFLLPLQMYIRNYSYVRVLWNYSSVDWYSRDRELCQRKILFLKIYIGHFILLFVCNLISLCSSPDPIMGEIFFHNKFLSVLVCRRRQKSVWQIVWKQESIKTQFFP